VKIPENNYMFRPLIEWAIIRLKQEIKEKITQDNINIHHVWGGAMCSCRSAEQTADHILFDCKLLEQERDKLKAAVLRSENWPVSKNKLINKHHKNFNIFTNNISFDKL
jgi:hypothetical protein